MISLRLPFAALAVASLTASAQTILEPPKVPPPTSIQMDYTQQGCPASPSTPASQTAILPTDYIELKLTVSFSPAGPFQIRVYGDGHVEREMFVCPLHPEDKTIHIDAEVAQRLLTRAREGGFGELCSYYSFVERPGQSVDGNATSITLSLNGQTKTVANALGNPPAIYPELSQAIEQISPMGKFSYSNLSDDRQAECKAIQLKRFNQNP